MSIRFFLACLLALLFASSAHAVQFERKLLESGNDYIIVNGSFLPGDNPAELEALIGRSKTKIVAFNSPGGLISSAMAIGRVIRRSGAQTMALRELECASACSLAFIGGVNRFAQAGAIGLHQFYSELPESMTNHQATLQAQHTMARQMEYVTEMGVDLNMLTMAMKYGPADMRYLSISEMEELRLIRNPNRVFALLSSPPAQETARPVTPAPRQPPSTASPSDRAITPRTGLVRHPRRDVILREFPTTKSRNLAVLRSGMRVNIERMQDRWYLVSVAGYRGFLHSTAVKVDQFHNSAWSHRFVQIKSFDNEAETRSFLRSFALPACAYLANNGWYAVTLARTFEKNAAIQTSVALKRNRRIPRDAFVTYGNTYVRRITCG